MFSQYSFNRKPFNSTSLLIEQVDLGTVTQSFLDVFVIQRPREVLPIVEVPIVEVTTEYLDLIAIIVNIEMLEYIESFFGVAINLGDAGELLQVLSDFTQTISKDKDGKNLSVSLVTARTRNTIRVDI